MARKVPAIAPAKPGWWKVYDVRAYIGSPVRLTRHPEHDTTFVQSAHAPCAVTLGGGSPRRGPKDTKAWAEWYKHGHVYREWVNPRPGIDRAGWFREFTLGPAPADMHREMMLEARPDKYWVEIGKQLRAARRG